MQDIRLRTLAAILLSLAAFMSLAGAAAALAWWLIFTNRFAGIKKIRMLLPVTGMLAFFSIVLALTGGDGLSYFFRMIVILFIGSWMFAEHKNGEFLHLGVWLLGERIGFELGMLADMGMQTLDLLARDFDQIRVAEELKGMHPGWRSLVPAGFILVNGALSRAGSTAEIMAARGYRDGGSFCPDFVTTGTDMLAGSATLCVLVIACIPVSEFFILSC